MKFQNKLVFLVGRENWKDDINLNQKLFDYLEKTDHDIIWEDEIWRSVHKLVRFQNRLVWLPSSFKMVNIRIFQMGYCLFHWDYMKCLFNVKGSSVLFRAQKLKENINKIGCEKEIVILSRSAGGRFSSLIADDFDAVKSIICLGYPFKHPEKELEPERFLHLKGFKTSMLIIQGDKDQYGGVEVKDDYQLSPSIDLFFVDADHDFNVSTSDWDDVILKIDAILNK